MQSPRPALSMAVLFSGTGRTLKNLIDRIEAEELHGKIRLAVASTPDACGRQFAEQAGIPAVVLERKDFSSQDEYSGKVFSCIRAAGAEWVVLAGFLKRLTIPDDFANRVLNIHPALVPAFCGKGFYGHHVHEAVLKYGAKISGCTVHFVDNEYDHGPVLLQTPVPVLDDDTADTLAARVFEAECQSYPQALQWIAEGRVTVHDRRVCVAPKSIR
ncbi:MAG: phosphoribosylglycinamide formyltransferase [Thermoguttaceae bacterium]